MSVSRQMLSTASDGSRPVADSRSPPAASYTRRCRAQRRLRVGFFSFYSKKFCRRCRGCVALRGCVLLSQEVVRLRRVVCAPRRLPLHSSLPPRAACITSLNRATLPRPRRHHLPQGHPPRAACITSLIERHYLANGDTLLLLVCLPLLSEDIVVQ